MVTFSSAERSRARVRVSAEDPGGFTRYVYFYVSFQPSDDARLSSLSLTGLEIGAFDGETTAYTAEAPHALAATTVSAQAEHADAVVAIAPTDADDNTPGHQVALRVGTNEITARVTAADGETTRTYTVTVSRSPSDDPLVSDDATLRGLELSGVDIGVFERTTTDYSAAVDSEVATTTVTAEPAHAEATVQIEDAAGSTLGTERVSALAVGANQIVVTVTAVDGETAKRYRVTVTRGGPPLTAELEDVPAHHDGSSTVGFDLRFSEQIDGLSYRTLRAGFQVDGGTLLQTRRKEPNSNVLWGIAVRPAGDGEVVATLPGGRPCGTAGAVCSVDGRMLSNSPTARVPGPVPVVTIASDGSPVTEGARAAFTLSRTGDGSAALAVLLTVSETGAALSGTAQSVAFDVGETTAALTLATDDDAVVEEASTVTAAVMEGDGYAVGAAAVAEVLVADNDRATFELTAAEALIEEGEETSLTVAIANGVVFAADQALTLAASGTASAEDYTLSTTSLTLLAGEESVSATLEANDDETEEVDETITVLATHDGAQVGSVIVTVAANDAIAPDDATLRRLELSGVDIGAFEPGMTDYSAAVDNDVARTTVTAEPAHPKATVEIADDAGNTLGTDQVAALSVGVNQILVTVTAADRETTGTYTVTVTRAAAPLTASFVSVPGHSGAGTTAVLRLAFSDAVSTSYAVLRDESFHVTGGSVVGARRVDGRSDLWDIEAEALSEEDVEVVLPETTDCAGPGAVCTGDGRPLSHELAATVAGPLPLAVAVDGVPQVGQILEARVSATPPPDLTYQWLGDGAAIAGATARTYPLTAADAGVRLSVRVRRDGRSRESAATIPIWGPPGNPPLAADEEELFSALMTVGSTRDAYPLHLAGYGRLTRASFGAVEDVRREDAAYELTAAFVNSVYQLTVGPPGTMLAGEDVWAYWDGFRIGPLAPSDGGVEGSMLAAQTPPPWDPYRRYLDGTSDGVQVALSIRRRATAPMVTVTAIAESVVEGELAVVELALGRPATAALTVSIRTQATGDVLAGESPDRVTVAPGASTARVSLETDDDRIVEGDGSVSVTLLAGDGYVLGEPSSATITVEDDDDARFTLSATPAALAEGGTSTLRLRLEDGVTLAESVAVGLSVTGDVTAPDYQLVPPEFTLTAGESAATATFEAVADTVEEAREEARISAQRDGVEVAAAAVTLRDASSDARLASLELTDVDIGPFDADTTSYAATVPAAVATTTVTAHPSDGHATVEIADTAGSTVGTERTSALAAGGNEIAATVTAEDGHTARKYTVAVTRESRPAWGTHLPERDIALGGSGESTGVWSDGSVLWALADSNLGAVRAYDLATGRRRGSRDLTLEDGYTYTALWSDDSALWAPSLYGGARAYRLSDGTRLPARDLDAMLTTAGNDQPWGLWSNDETLYVADLEDARVYAYQTDGTRLAARELELRREDVHKGWPSGLWSDGETALVSWYGRGRVLAYRLNDGARLRHRDIDTGSAGNGDPRDLWSDGHTLWVADGQDRKLYAYAVPGLQRTNSPGLLPVRVTSRAASVPSSAPGLPAVIADGTLRARIAAALGKAPGSTIGMGELAALAALDAREAGIADLTGLEQAVNLAAVDLGGNPLTDLRPLAALAKLRVLNLDGTGAQPRDVAAFGALERLSLRGNSIDDVSALVSLAQLQVLDLAGNALTDIGPLAGLAALEVVDLRGNPVENLKPITELPEFARPDAQE